MYSDRNPNVKMCVFVCPNGYYIQHLANNWTCVTTCINNNYFIDYVNKKCVLTCPAGYYAYSNGSCLTACPSPLYANPFLRVCDSSCTHGYFSDPTTRFCVR